MEDENSTSAYYNAIPRILLAALRRRLFFAFQTGSTILDGRFLIPKVNYKMSKCVFRHEGEKCGFWHSVKNVINEGCKGFLGDPRLIHRHFLSRGAAEGQKDDELTEGRQENPCNPSEMTFLTEGSETTLCPSGEHHFFPPSAEKHSIKSFHTYWGLLMSYSVSFLSFWLFFWVFFGGGEFKKMTEFGEREDKPVEKSFSSLAYPPARQCHKGNFLTAILEAMW